MNHRIFLALPFTLVRFPIKKIDDKIDWREGAGSVALMESHLSSSEAYYKILTEISLTTRH